MTIKLGCHCSTWELDYDKEIDYFDEILDQISDAGFEGIDIQVAMLGDYVNNPDSLKEELKKRNINVGSFTVPFDWHDEKENKEEFERANKYIDFATNFPGVILNLPARNSIDRSNLLQKQKNIISCVNAVAKRAYDKNVRASFHPASPMNNCFRTKEDYDFLFENIDRRYLGYTPDAGHIKMGGMDPLQIIKDNFEIVRHVHFKDCSNNKEWKKMGEGDIDFKSIVDFLESVNYNGWIMVEEETKEASQNPFKAISDIRKYFKETILR